MKFLSSLWHFWNFRGSYVEQFSVGLPYRSPSFNWYLAKLGSHAMQSCKMTPSGYGKYVTEDPDVSRLNFMKCPLKRSCLCNKIRITEQEKSLHFVLVWVKKIYKTFKKDIPHCNQCGSSNKLIFLSLNPLDFQIRIYMDANPYDDVWALPALSWDRH